MELTTTVRNAGKGNLCLKACGPRLYEAQLSDYSKVEWKDQVRFRVTSVDHDAETLIGEYVEHI